MARNIVQEQEMIKTLPDELLERGLSQPQANAPFTQYLGAIEMGRRVRDRKAAAAASNAAQVRNQPVVDNLVAQAQSLRTPAQPQPVAKFGIGGMVTKPWHATIGAVSKGADFQKEGMMKQFGIDRALEKPGTTTEATDPFGRVKSAEELAAEEQLLMEQEGTLGSGRRGVVFNKGGAVMEPGIVKSYRNGGPTELTEVEKRLLELERLEDPIIKQQAAAAAYNLNSASRNAKADIIEDYSDVPTGGLTRAFNSLADRWDYITGTLGSSPEASTSASNEIVSDPSRGFVQKMSEGAMNKLSKIGAVAGGIDAGVTNKYGQVMPREASEFISEINEDIQTGYDSLFVDSNQDDTTPQHPAPGTVYTEEYGAIERKPKAAPVVNEQVAPPVEVGESASEKTERLAQAVALARAAAAFTDPANASGSQWDGFVRAATVAADVGVSEMQDADTVTLRQNELEARRQNMLAIESQRQIGQDRRTAASIGQRDIASLRTDDISRANIEKDIEDQVRANLTFTDGTNVTIFNEDQSIQFNMLPAEEREIRTQQIIRDQIAAFWARRSNSIPAGVRKTR